MGKLILCSGARTNRPYTFPSTGIRIYSMEELCYYLYQHVYLIEEDLFRDSLFDFIEEELKLPERASKLRLLKKQKADIKTLVTVILCSTDYYTEYEIKSLLKTLDEIIGMPFIKRSCIKAITLLKNRQYSEAAGEYERIINSKEAAKLTPEEYGDLFHNLAVAKLHITGLKEASRLFYQAYERNHREESLKQYLYTLKLLDHNESYKEKIQEFQIDKETEEDILSYLEQMESMAKDSKILQEIKLLHNTQAKNQNRDKLEEIINSWKAKIRQQLY